MGDGPPGFRRDFTCPAVLRIHSGENECFDYRAVTFYGGPFQTASSTPFLFTPYECPTTPRGKPLGLGCFRFARRYSGNRICFLFLWVLRCFSSPGLPSIPYVFRYGYHPITDSGFPHSEIPGSTLTYSSPRHIGVRPVLHRLLVPRHPPCALFSLTYIAILLVDIDFAYVHYLVFKVDVILLLQELIPLSKIFKRINQYSRIRSCPSKLNKSPSLTKLIVYRYTP